MFNLIIAKHFGKVCRKLDCNQWGKIADKKLRKGPYFLEKSQIRVLVVDDDPSMLNALGEVVKSSGFLPVLCTNPTEAASQFHIQGAQFLIIDCMLPKMAGV